MESLPSWVRRNNLLEVTSSWRGGTLQEHIRLLRQGDAFSPVHGCMGGCPTAIIVLIEAEIRCLEPCPSHLHYSFAAAMSMYACM